MNKLARADSSSLSLKNTQRIRTVVQEAIDAVEHATQKCLTAGQLLNDYKEKVGFGSFMEWRREAFPKISDDRFERWMRAAANVARALPAPAIDVTSEVIPLSEIISTPDDELPAAALQWKQQWFEFTADKTIKECMEGVCVEGDEAHRADRAINGKTKGGAGGDRKDFPLFVAVKLKDMGAHFSHWEAMTQAQKAEVITNLSAAIKGEAVTLRKRTFNFSIWPDEVCEAVAEALKDRMRGAKK